RTAARPRVEHAASGARGRDRHLAGHDRADRGGAAAGGGTPARLAAVDLDLVGPRARDPGGVLALRAAARASRWLAVARPRAVQGPQLQRRVGRPARVLVRTGVVLLDPRPLPPARPRSQRAAVGTRVHDPGGLVSGGIDARAGADPASRQARA